MKLLNEEILFGANQLQTIKAIVAKSSLSNVVLTNNTEKKLVKAIMDGVHKNSNNTSIIYLVLKAASLGPDTSKNFLLKYIDSLDSNVMSRYSNNVDTILEYLQSGQIQHGNDVDKYLLNKNLYSRQDKDFEYTVRAFDAVIYKKNKYFNVENGAVSVSIDKKTLINFFGTSITPDSGYAQDDEFDYDLDEALLNEASSKSYITKVPLDQKYFFDNKDTSQSDKIIPAGLNGNDISKRTIWNYMEIWTNSVDRSAKDDKEKEDADILNSKVNKAKEAIKKSNMSDDIQNSIIKLIDELS